MKKSWILGILLFFGMTSLVLAEIPPSWLQDWQKPGKELRPLQIIHGYFGVNKEKWAHPYLAFGHFDGKSIAEGMRFLKEDCGLGGVVCNVSSYGYLTDEEEWQHFLEAVRQAKANDLRVWIYDEDRYPSLAAGGLVLKENPHLEAKELVYDSTATEPFTVRPCFEYTHASNNFAYIRRYPSLVHPGAAAAFLRWTHENYQKRLGAELFDYVEAFFTDEPSTNAMNSGLLSEKVREGVRTVDKIDPEKPLLPMVVWEDDFPQEYRKRYGEDLLAARKSLFTGDTAEDKKVRQQFWQMVTERAIESYYGQIARWCEAHGKAFTGHGLWEESLYAHVPLDGNKLRTLKMFSIPGMDCLNSEPHSVFSSYWKAAMLASSAAVSSGKRKAFTEISDIATYFNGKPRASVAQMNATAAWQAALGITEFTLYYQITDRTPEEYRQYGDFVGRMNAILRDASMVYDAVLLYPITDLQREYLPQKIRPELKNQPEIVQKICRSYDCLGVQMLRSQTTFLTAEEDDLQAILKNQTTRPSKLVLPEGMTISAKLQKILDEFRRSGGEVSVGTVAPQTVLTPATREIVRGTLVREGYPIQILVNVSSEVTYSGQCAVTATTCHLFLPATGEIRKLPVKDGHVEISLQPLETWILLEENRP